MSTATIPATIFQIAAAIIDSSSLADLSVSQLKEMRTYILGRLQGQFWTQHLEEDYRRTLAGIEFEIEARARRRDAEYRSTLMRVLAPTVRMVALLICVGVLLANAGCATNPDDRTALSFATREARNAQLGITALIALDTAQTVTIARSPDCLYEGNSIAAKVFGSDTPSTQRVLLTNAAYIAAHWALGSFLDRKAETINFDDLENDADRRRGWKILRVIYQGLTIVGHGAAVANNFNQGIGLATNYSCGR